MAHGRCEPVTIAEPNTTCRRKRCRISRRRASRKPLGVGARPVTRTRRRAPAVPRRPRQSREAMGPRLAAAGAPRAARTSRRWRRGRSRPTQRGRRIEPHLFPHRGGGAGGVGASTGCCQRACLSRCWIPCAALRQCLPPHAGGDHSPSAVPSTAAPLPVTDRNSRCPASRKPAACTLALQAFRVPIPAGSPSRPWRSSCSVSRANVARRG